MNNALSPAAKARQWATTLPPMIPLRSRFVFVALIACLGLPGITAAGNATTTTREQPNILMIVADDFGVDQLACYGICSDTAPTPFIDRLAEQGRVFRNAWSNPVCSPTRATIQTGRYGFRTGIGIGVNLPFAKYALQLRETTIPEMLDRRGSGYAHAAIGKWHLADERVGGYLAPNVAGYGHFAGSMQYLVDYFNWTKVVNGQLVDTSRYATSVTVDDALDWIQTTAEPWFCCVNFQAPHSPFHDPPPDLHSINITNQDDKRGQYLAMVEAMDREIGRLIQGLGQLRENTNVIFLGDNGTPARVIDRSCFPLGNLRQHKGTLYQGGICIPLIIAGPSVHEPGWCDALVNTTDLFATVVELAGVDLDTTHEDIALDSISLMPYLEQPTLGSIRRFALAEHFSPNGPPGTVRLINAVAVRDDRFKYIYNQDPERYPSHSVVDAFYDLADDPFETNNLLDGELTPNQERRLRRLQDAIVQITGQ